MGLIDRVKDDLFDKFVQDGEDAAKREQVELELNKRRIEVIAHRLEVVASKLNEPLVHLTEEPVGLPRYYLIGDVVIMVQRFLGGEEKPNPDKPALMTFSYCTYLMALDDNKKLKHRKIGTLRFLDYSGIANAIAEAPPNYEFNAEAVKLCLP